MAAPRPALHPLRLSPSTKRVHGKAGYARVVGGRAFLKIQKLLNHRKYPLSLEALQRALGNEALGRAALRKILSSLEETGWLRRISIGTGKDLFISTHQAKSQYVVVCRRPDRVELLDPTVSAVISETMAQLEKKLSAEGYPQISHRLIFHFSPSPKSVVGWV